MRFCRLRYLPLARGLVRYLPAMNPAEFALTWMGSTWTERAAAQEQFIDLCRMLNAQTPNEADPTGDWYAFEKGAFDN